MESFMSLIENLPEGWQLEWLHAFANDYDEYFTRQYIASKTPITVELPIMRHVEDTVKPMAFAAYWATMITMNAVLPKGVSSSGMQSIHSPQHGDAYTVLDRFPLMIPKHLTRQFVHLANSRKLRLVDKAPCGCDTCSFMIRDEQVYWPETMAGDEVVVAMPEFDCAQCGETIPYETLAVLDDETKLDLREYAFLIFQEKVRFVAMVVSDYDYPLIQIQAMRIKAYRGFGVEASDA